MWDGLNAFRHGFLPGMNQNLIQVGKRRSLDPFSCLWTFGVAPAPFPTASALSFGVMSPLV
jgi:hypothetical protein